MDHSYDVINPKIEMSDEEGQTIEEETVQPSPESLALLEEEADDTECAGGEKLKQPHNFYSKLIDLVRSYPNIYDKFDPGFKSPLERGKSWSEIASTLNTSVAIAQNRWTRLRERFAREKKALEIMQQTGGINERKRLWPYFLPMLFLSSHIKPRNFRSGSSGLDSSSSDPLSGDMSISKFLSVMGDKLFEELNVPSTSSPNAGKDVEIVENRHSDYVAWRKRKIEPATTTTLLQPQRKILAKPDAAFTTVMFTTKGKDGENKILTKLPPGAVLLKNAPGTMGNSPVVLVPAAPTTGVSIGKANTVPMILSTTQQASFNQACEALPTPNSAEHHFGMLIARELERFPKEVRAKKKQRILMVLYE